MQMLSYVGQPPEQVDRLNQESQNKKPASTFDS